MLTASQITLPATDRDVMNYSSACEQVRKWTRIAESLAFTPAAVKKEPWARAKVQYWNRRVEALSQRILGRQGVRTRRQSMLEAGMTGTDMVVFRARRISGDRHVVRLFGRLAADFATRDEAETFCDFAPLLIAQGTCPACLEKHADLRAHIGTAPCGAKRDEKKGARA